MLTGAYLTTTHEPEGYRHHSHRRSRPGTGRTKPIERKGSNLAERSQKNWGRDTHRPKKGAQVHPNPFSLTRFYGDAVSPICRPGRWGMRKIISTARTAEAFRSPTPR